MTNTEAWDYAIGIIKVDGLEPTKEFKEYIEKEKRGELTMDDLKLFLDNKYKVKDNEEESAAGGFNEYVDISLIAEEKDAWKNAAIKKHS